MNAVRPPLTGRVCWCGHDSYYHHPDGWCEGHILRAEHEREPDYLMGNVYGCPCEMPAFEPVEESRP